jgi:hypothetical protein
MTSQFRAPLLGTAGLGECASTLPFIPTKEH